MTLKSTTIAIAATFLIGCAAQIGDTGQFALGNAKAISPERTTEGGELSAGILTVMGNLLSKASQLIPGVGGDNTVVVTAPEATIECTN